MEISTTPDLDRKHAPLGESPRMRFEVALEREHANSDPGARTTGPGLS